MKKENLIKLSDAIENSDIDYIKTCILKLTESDKEYILNILNKEVELKLNVTYNDGDILNDYGLILNTLVTLEYGNKELSYCLNKDFKEFFNLIVDINTLNFIERISDISNMSDLLKNISYSSNLVKSMLEPQIKVFCSCSGDIDFKCSSLSDNDFKAFRDCIVKNSEMLKSIGYLDFLEQLSNETLVVKIINEVLNENGVNDKQNRNKRRI